MLDAFGKELKAFRGPDKDFHSYILTPVLQHQLQGPSYLNPPSILFLI
jgi:hypothetical protein